MFFDEYDVRVIKNDRWQKTDLKSMFKLYGGFRLSFNAEYHRQQSAYSAPHVTCLSMSNKGFHVLLGYSDGCVHKRNLD